MATLGLRGIVRAFSSGGEWGLLSVSSAWALERAGLSSCGSPALELRLGSGGAQAQLSCSMWGLFRLRAEPMSPASAGRFLTTEPPGKCPSYC